MLRDRDWKAKYTPDDSDLVRRFYIPVLRAAVRYDRLTGYFTAGALTLASRGIEGLIRNRGHMRLLVGCTLDPPEIEAIARGESMRSLVEVRLRRRPLVPDDVHAKEALELLAWMVATGRLSVKVGVPMRKGRPVTDRSILHAKVGVVRDGRGDGIAWSGSLNETRQGWKGNFEAFHVFRSWRDPEGRVPGEEADFEKLWENRSPSLRVLDVPDAVREQLLKFRPEDLPSRLLPKPAAAAPAAAPDSDLRSRIWRFLAEAPARKDGERVAEATAPVDLWPHQVRTMVRPAQHDGLPRMLIADEVGLGKTIQAGMLVRRAWLAGRAGRVLILRRRRWWASGRSSCARSAT